MLLDRLAKSGGDVPFVAPWGIEDLVQLDMAASPASPGLARRAVAEACARWDIPEDKTDAATLAISELVTNAVIHAGTPVLVFVEYKDHNLTLAVGDGDPALPQLHEPTPEADHGRGVIVLDRLGGTWGIQRTVLGKTVWITIVV